MNAVLRILGLWRGQAAWLGFGLLVALASIGTGVALLALAGAHVAVMVAGGVATAGLLLQVVGPARVVLRYFERLVTHNATFRALADLRVWFFRGLTRSSAGGLGMQRSGDLAARMVGDVEALDGLYLRIIVPLAGGLMLLPAMAVLLGQGDPWLALGVTVLLAITAVAIPAAAARSSAQPGHTLAEANSALRLTVVDTLTGLRDIRAFGAEAPMLERLRLRDAAAHQAQRAVARRGAMAQAAGFVCAQAAILLVLLQAGGRPVFAVGAVFLTVAAFEAAAGLPRAGALAGYAAAAARRVLEAAERAPAIAEPTSPAAAPIRTALRIEGVDFRWQADRGPVFDGLTLDIPQGARVAILGPSGSGKSTIAALLLKVAAPQAGRILLGGVDIAALDSAVVRARFGWLAQDTHLFDDSIRNNLLLGQPGANEAALWLALDEAEVGEFVRALPDQLDSWLGEGGARVSGGQGRRIALARTLLSQAPILLLDEPGAGLDAETERAFLATLNGLDVNRTVILIAHRLTGVERLDRIWRLSAGHAIAAAA